MRLSHSNSCSRTLRCSSRSGLPGNGRVARAQNAHPLSEDIGLERLVLDAAPHCFSQLQMNPAPARRPGVKERSHT